MKTINAEKLRESIRAHAGSELRENRVGAKEVIVRQDGKEIYHGLFGSARVGGPPLESGMLYRAASMTKPITAAAVLQLADRGMLDIDEEASRYYPELKTAQVAVIADGRIAGLRPARGVIRVSDLLSHTGGIGCSPVSEVMPEDDGRLSFEQALKRILSRPLSFDPGTAQAYSATQAFDLAAGIVALVSGIPFDEYLKENIFEPLGMTDTTFAPDESQRERIVTMHDRTPDGQSADTQMPEGCVFESYLPERTAAGAGLASTAEDYMRFAEMLCAGGSSADGTRILSEAAVRRMSTSNVPEKLDMGTEQWGLGVRVITKDDYPQGLGVGCFGWSGAYGTHFWVDPANRISVVMMKNSRYDGGAGNRSARELERDVSDSLV